MTAPDGAGTTLGSTRTLMRRTFLLSRLCTARSPVFILRNPLNDRPVAKSIYTNDDNGFWGRLSASGAASRRSPGVIRRYRGWPMRHHPLAALEGRLRPGVLRQREPGALGRTAAGTMPVAGAIIAPQDGRRATVPVPAHLRFLGQPGPGLASFQWRCRQADEQNLRDGREPAGSSRSHSTQRRTEWGSATAMCRRRLCI